MEKYIQKPLGGAQAGFRLRQPYAPQSTPIAAGRRWISRALLALHVTFWRCMSPIGVACHLSALHVAFWR